MAFMSLAMFLLVMAPVQAVIMMIVIVDVDHFAPHRRFAPAGSHQGRTRGATQRAANDGSIAPTHGGAYRRTGRPSQGTTDDRVSIHALGLSGIRHTSQYYPGGQNHPVFSHHNPRKILNRAMLAPAGKGKDYSYVISAM